MTTGSPSYLAYHEPSPLTLLILSSFLLISNILNSLFDGLIYCGLLAQVSIGVAFGTPGFDILGREFENGVVGVGYLGLILLVYEGGLSTNIKSLRSNILLSSLVALTGVTLPIALSFTLGSLVNATPLQCFAAGAALCSTSLGTTFTILRTSGLAKSKLGVVLASAAMMDDVIGLIMVQVISNLGSAGSKGEFGWRSVVRPLGVSFAFGIGVPSVCYLIKPVVLKPRKGVVERVLRWEHVAFVMQTGFLVGMVTTAIYAGTSGLFAAYLAGAVISWWGDLKPPKADGNPNVGITVADHTGSAAISNETTTPTRSVELVMRQTQELYAVTGLEVYEKYYAAAVHRILKPFFFASIGFAIPIKEMFSAQIVWRGIVYSILMAIAKLLTGLWLVRFTIVKPKLRVPRYVRKGFHTALGCLSRKNAAESGQMPRQERGRENAQELQPQNTGQSSSAPPTISENVASGEPSSTNSAISPSQQTQSQIQKPLSLYPAAMLGTAMTARGEIGFLIASVAASTGLFDDQAHNKRDSRGSSQIYLVNVWAVVLCTIAGPLSVGSLVRRVKRLEAKNVEDGQRRVDGPLGVWGLE